MPESSNTTVFRGDSADFIQAVAKNIAKTKEMEKELGKLTGQTKKLTKEEKEFARATKKAYDDIRGPQERHLQRLRALKKLVQDNKITQKEYGRAVEQSQVKLDRAGRSGRDAFGARAIADLKGYAMGFASVTAAITAAVGALRDMKQLRDELAAKQRQAAHPLGRLATLAGGDPKETKRLQTAARDFFAAGGGETLREAGDTAFEMFSADPKVSKADRDFMARLSTVDDPTKVAQASGVIMQAMGKKETGGFRAIASKAMAAARPATGVDPGQILVGTAEPAEAAKPLDLSDEEVMAAVSIISQKTGKADKAGTRVNALLRSLGRRGFVEQHKGESLAEMLSGIRQMDMTMPEQIKFFGRQEAQQAFGALDPSALRARTGEIKQAERSAMANKVIDAAMLDPIVRENRRTRKSKAGKELAGEPLGIAASRGQRAVDWAETRFLESGDERGAFAARHGGNLMRMTYGDTAMSGPAQAGGYALRTPGGIVARATPGLGALVEVASGLRDATENLLRLGEVQAAKSHQRPVQQSNN